MVHARMYPLSQAQACQASALSTITEILLADNKVPGVLCVEVQGYNIRFF